MGNCLRSENKKSKEPKENAPQAHEQSNQHVVKKSAEPKSWDIRRQKLNLADYQFMNKTDETLVKAPGSLNGEQFVVDTCANCTIYLCDTTATVLIDDCENCRFYIGPCASSVFVRKMKNCQMIIACQQFRTRDCEDLDVMIFSQTPPIIESSNNLRFGCFKFGYFELQQQFQKVELNVWNNRWSEIFDFTKKKSKNFSFLPEDLDPYDLIPRISALPGGEFSDPSSEEVDLLVPITTGDRPKLYDQEILFVLAPGYENTADQMIPEINKQSDFEVIKARSFALTQDYLQQIPSAEQAIIKRLIDAHQVKLGKDSFIFIHFGGKSLSEDLYPFLGRVFTDKKSYHIWSNNKVIAELTKLIFETFREGE